MLKFSENPPMRPSQSAGHDEPMRAWSGDWWVGHTRSRFEKAFAWDLNHRGIGYFLPMHERVRVSGGRKRRVCEPLFPSYVFFCGDGDTRYQAMCTGRLCQVIPVTQPVRLVSELEAIERVVTGEQELDLYPQLAVGRRGRVTAGPMQGLEGIIIQRQDHKARLVLQVSMLGQGAAVEIDLDLVEAVESEGDAGG